MTQAQHRYEQQKLGSRSYHTNVLHILDKPELVNVLRIRPRSLFAELRYSLFVFADASQHVNLTIDRKIHSKSSIEQAR